MYLYGASGHAKVIAETLKENGIEIEGVYDDNTAIQSFCNYPFLGVLNTTSKQQTFIISIGNNIYRKKIANNLHVDWGQAISKYANISDSVLVGCGTVVMKGVSINVDVKIGTHVILNTNCSIDHDCIIDDFVHIAPGSTLCGNVFVGEGTLLGAGSVVLPGIKIGKWCIIGAGSVVTKDIPDNMIVIGVPAKILRHKELCEKVLSGGGGESPYSKQAGE